MSIKIYTLRDKVAGVFGAQLLFYDNDDAAKRGFYEIYHDTIDKSPNSALASYPADFELHCLGTYNYETGEIYSDPYFICSANIFAKEV